MTITWHMTSTTATPVAEANLRRETNARAAERRIQITWDATGTAASIERETPVQLRARMDRDEAMRQCRAVEQALQYIFPASEYRI